MVKKLYPGGKAKAFNVSYDDGVVQDIRFVELLNKYGLKGTFNLNSGLMEQEFEWVHECGMTVKRLSPMAAAGLYHGHEVACHTRSHPYMDYYSEAEIMDEIASDKENLEKLFGCKIAGYATPFYFYSDLVARCVQNCGLEYARISETDLSYTPRSEYYRWKGGLFHESEELESYVEGFLKTEEELALCQIVGHSYDLDVYDMWERIERILKAVSECSDVWPATHIDLVRYLRRMEKAKITQEYIRNDSEDLLWFCINGEVKKLLPGETMYIT